MIFRCLICRLPLLLLLLRQKSCRRSVTVKCSKYLASQRDDCDAMEKSMGSRSWGTGLLVVLFVAVVACLLVWHTTMTSFQVVWFGGWKFVFGVALLGNAGYLEMDTTRLVVDHNNHRKRFWKGSENTSRKWKWSEGKGAKEKRRGVFRN